MKRHKQLPPRRDTRITSQYIPADGSIVISVARGWTGAGEILYRLEAEKLAGAIEDRKELAVIVNNLGLLVLAQLSGFNLADSLDELPKALAEWGHIDVKALTDAEEADNIQKALTIAQKTVHQMHGHEGGCEAREQARGECTCKCDCEGTEGQIICAQYCDLCRDNEQLRALDPKFAYTKESSDEGPREGGGASSDTAPRGAEDVGDGADSSGAGAS